MDKATEQGYVKTPWGIFLVEYSSHTIYRHDYVSKNLGTRQINQAAQALINQLIKQGQSIQLSPQGTTFQKKVWKALQKIPPGQIRTYLDIAKAIGSPQSVRAVANAIGKNPICVFIPCHRVIRSDGTLGGFSSGIELKKTLLRYEGINPPTEGL